VRAPRPLSIFVALSCGLVGFAPAVQHDQLAPARARWATLDVEQRELAHERFRHLQGMDGEERAAFDRRARELRSLRGELESELSSAERAALEALPYHDRMRLLGEQLRDELSLRGRALRERLPDAVTNELERHLRRGPRDVHSFLAGQRERGSHHLAAQIAAELGRPEEVERLKRLTHEQRADAVMELMKELAIQRTLEQEGALEEIGSQAWDEWLSLDAPRFLKQLELYGPRPEQPFPWRHHRRALGPHPESEASPAERQRMGALGRLLEEARPRMRERLREGRRNERSSVDDAVAERVQTYLHAHPDLLPAGVARGLEGLEGRELVDAVREAVHAEREAFRKRFGPPPGFGRPPGPRGGMGRGPGPDERPPRGGEPGRPGGPGPSGPRPPGDEGGRRRPPR